MRRLIRTLGWALLAALLLGAAAIAGGLVVLGNIGPFDDTVIRLDDTTLTLASFGWTDWITLAVGIGVGLIVTFVVVVVVVPFAVLLPLLLVALAVCGVFGGVLLAVALAFSPLILLAGAGWLVWRLARGRQEPRRGDATMPR